MRLAPGVDVLVVGTRTDETVQGTTSEDHEET
jgi:hypothetical protein